MSPVHHVFVDLGLLFGAALIGGGLAQYLRQPLVLGYLLGGILVGPFTPGPTISDPTSFQLFAEIGVVLLMFSIGLEFSLEELVHVRRVALAGTPLAIGLVTAVTVGLGALMGWPLEQSLLVGASVSVASTMVLSKFLLERGELNSPHGKVIIGISLAEDLAVVILMVVLQTLGEGRASAGVLLGALAQAVLLLVPLLWMARRVVPRLFAWVARAGNMELFLLVAMAVSIGTAALTASLGLSLALGAFLAGLVISDSEFARETLARVLPIRDLFVAVFFVSMGTLIPPLSVVAEWPTVTLLSVLVVVGNALIWMGVVRAFGYPARTTIMVGLGLSQIGEFSYVLMAMGRNAGLVSDPVFRAVLATSVVTILANSLLFRRTPRWLASHLQTLNPLRTVPSPSDRSLQDHVVICGFGRVGREVADALRRFDIPYAVLDIDPEVTALVRRGGGVAVFGEAGHDPVLESAGVEMARMVIVAIPDFEGAAKCVQAVRRMRSDVPVLVRVHQGRHHALMAVAGATTVVQPEIEAGLAMVRHSLEHLGVEHHVGRQYIEEKRASQSLTLRDGGSRHVISSKEICLTDRRDSDDALTVRALHARTGATIASVLRSEGDHIVDPEPNKVIRPGDRMIAIGTSEQLQALNSLCAEREE